jgi:hypothetical protein
MRNGIWRGWIVGALFLSGMAAAQAQTLPLALVLEQDTIDRLSTGNRAKLTPDGVNDGVFTARFAPGTGEHTITKAELRGTNNTFWDTDPATLGWTLGIARGLTSSLLNEPDGPVSFTVADGGSITIFASERGNLVDPSIDYTLTLTYADGSTAGMNTKNDLGIFIVQETTPVDRISTGAGGITAGPDGKNDRVFSVMFPPGLGEQTVTNMVLTQGRNLWDTDLTLNGWAIAAARTPQDTILNAADNTVSFPVPDGGSFSFLVTDSGRDTAINPALVYTLQLTFANGQTPAVLTKARGDINMDDKINILDATLSIQMGVGSITPNERQKILGDVNADGRLNLQDTTLILLKSVS